MSDAQINTEKQDDIQILKYKTRGNASPQGRPRVYFCCHKEDFARTFTPITDELLEIQKNSAIWYRNPALPYSEDPQFLENLRQMQLFVIPVTGSFLDQEDPARTVEMAFAIKNHIPVLPLMQEPGLENKFNRICGDLQFLDKTTNANDPTALPYDQKLKKFLNAILVGDELAARIRAAFDAYIFLSYRKKDRAAAQQIMRLIHSNEFCRDTAIWYDEFLTPGENFNDEIKAAMENSSLFVLVVTPNLLAPGNYIQEFEYKWAKELEEKKATGKEPGHKYPEREFIFPIEAISTDAQKLSEMYEGIRASVPMSDPETVAKRLRELLTGIALRKSENDRTHKFLIGMAYLSGLDVEVDHDRALDLIRQAADAGLFDAYEKLVVMYRAGEGVERNYHTAVEIQKKYVDLLREKISQERSGELSVRFWRQLLDLGRFQEESGNLKSAKESYLELLDYIEETVRKGWDIRFSYILPYEKLILICQREGNLSEAAGYCDKALEISRTIVDETHAVEAWLSLSLSYRSLGDIHRAKGELKKAKSFYGNSLRILKLISEKTDKFDTKSLLAANYSRLGDICRDERDLSSAKSFYIKALELQEKITEEGGTAEARRDLAVDYNEIGEIIKQEGDPDTAILWCLKAVKMLETYADEVQTPEARRDLCLAYGRVGDICVTELNLKKAQDYYQKAMEISQAIADETGTAEARRDLSFFCGRLGQMSISFGDLRNAMLLFYKAYELRSIIAMETRTKEDRFSLATAEVQFADICKANGDFGLADMYYQGALKTIQTYADETGTFQARRNLSDICIKLGDNYLAQKKMEEAEVLYRKALEVLRAIADETHTIEARNDLADGYDKFGKFWKEGGDTEQAKVNYIKSMKIREKIANETGTAQARRNLSVSSEIIGDICLQEKNQNGAKTCYMTAMMIRLDLFQKKGTVESYDDLAVILYKLGLLTILDISERQAFLEQFVNICELLYGKTGRKRY